MLRIELTGASGVGKTTLYNFISNSLVNRNFITLREAYIEAAKREPLPRKDLYRQLLQIALKINLFGSRHLGIAKTVLDLPAKYNNLLSHEDFTQFSIAYDIFYNKVKKRDTSAKVIHKHLSNLMNAAEELVMMQHLYPNHTPILFDEGVVHYQNGITDYGWSQYSFSEMKSDAALNPDGVIYCRQDKEVIFRQALKRRKEGINTFSQGSLSEKELRDFVNKDVEMHVNKINSFERLGVPVLRINTGEKMDLNLKRIDDFIVEVINS